MRVAVVCEGGAMEEEPRAVDDESLIEPLLEPEDVAPNLPVAHKKEGVGEKLLSWVCTPIRLTASCGIACMLLAQILNGCIPLTFKGAAQHGMPVFQTLLCRSLSSATLSLATGLGTVHWKKLFLISNGVRWLVVVQAIFGNIDIISYCISVMYMVEGDATALARTSLLFASVLGWMIGWDVLSFQILGGVLICSVGATVVDHPPFLFGDDQAWSRSRSIGSILAVFSAFASAIFLLSLGRIGSKVETITLVLWYHSFGAFMAAVPLLAGIPSSPVFKLEWKAWLWLLVFCTFVFLITVFSLRGTQLCNATLASSLRTTSVIVTYLVGFFMVGEKISLFGVFGSLGIIVGIILIAKGKGKIQKVR